MTFEEWWNTKDYPDCCLLRCKRAFNEGRAELEKKNKKLESDFGICEKNADTYYDQRTKAKEIIKDLIDLGKIWLSEEDDDYSFIEQAEQFLKEIEK